MDIGTLSLIGSVVGYVVVVGFKLLTKDKGYKLSNCGTRLEKARRRKDMLRKH